MIRQIVISSILLVSLGFLSGCKKQTVYSFTEAPIVMSSGTDGSAGKSGTYVLFGDWPQSVKAKNVSVDERESLKKGGFVYYLGDDGNYYVKVLERAFNPSLTYSDGSNAISKKSAEKSYRYFKVEPIKWRLVTKNYNQKNYTLLIAESILESGIPFYLGSTTRQIEEDVIFPNNYEYSILREWLNGPEGFYETAFSAGAKEKIRITEVDNTSIQMSYDGENGINTLFSCSNTLDKVFLPSTYELTASGGYGFPKYTASYGEEQSAENKLRIRKSTDYSVARGCFQSVSKDLGGAWWTRSPSYFSNYDIRYVMDTGKMLSTDYVFDDFTGIVPAICINLE